MHPATVDRHRAGLRLRRSGTICLRWMIQRPGCAHPAAPRAANAADVGNHPTRRRCAAKTKESAPRWPWAGRRWQPQPPGFEAGHPAPRQRWLIQRAARRWQHPGHPAPTPATVPELLGAGRVASTIQQKQHPVTFAITFVIANHFTQLEKSINFVGR